jgi:hypothetical protein
MTEETTIDSATGILFKKYAWILMVDNYANTKYAAEQTGIKKRLLHQQVFHYPS